jgi:hypothetical protein
MSEKQFPNIQTYKFKEISFKHLMQNRVHNVLIICSNYDFYLLEEDGRIDEQIFAEYTSLNLRYPPNILHANSTKKALNVLKHNHIELVINWLDKSISSYEVANKVKFKYPHIPIVALSHYPKELQNLLDKKKKHNIDYVFHWNGNVTIFISIIKLVEDSMNAERDINEIGVKAILLVEDTISFYTRYLPIFYSILFKQTQSFIQEGLNAHKKILSKRGRPKILLAKTFEEAIDFFNKYKENILGVISDVTYTKNQIKDKQAGFHFLKHVRAYKKLFPVIIQSSDLKNREKAIEYHAQFLYKHSETIGIDLKKLITKYFSFGDFEFWNPKEKKVIRKAKDLKRFQKSLTKVPLTSIVYHAKRNDFSKWLRARSLFPLAKLFSLVEYDDFSKDKQIRQFLSDSVKAFRIYRSRGIITKFDRKQYDEYQVFSRIGDGALGGKGRGLAFIDLFLKNYNLANKYKNITISIPRTVVLSTDVFDEFMETNNLYPFIASQQDDETILQEFISKPLPKWVIKDIKYFLSTANFPIAIRSSSVLEDSLYQPFAGVFATYMVPNTGLDKLQNMVCNAIRSVIASTFYKNSKAYTKATAHAIEESKMAVILQEVVGTQYDDVYFPNISGVARSINFYPIGEEQPNEGIVNIALGLGEYIVGGGGKTLRFSPFHPKNILQLSSTKTALKETQKYFNALDMNPDNYIVSTSEAINKKKINLREAKDHKALKFVASTYDMHSNQIRSGVFHDGARILTFESILQQESFPLTEILKDLLRIGKREMHNPIEIEFAVNLDVPEDKPRIFSFLQIRPIVEQNDSTHQITEKVNLEDTIIYSKSALGNGVYNNITDLVYIKPDVFDASKTIEIANKLEEINDTFDKDEKNYILIGPGRWGSSDPWLGIPISWSQISAAKIIVESGLENYRIDPSQGTHFFQNLTSLRVGYLTINSFMNDGFLDIEYLNKQKIIYEDTYIRHVNFDNPLSIIIDGRNRKAIVYKEGFDSKNRNSIDTDDSILG